MKTQNNAYDIEEVKRWIYEWIEAETEELKTQPRKHADADQLVRYWRSLIRHALVHGSLEELMRTKTKAVRNFLEIGKSHQWIERHLTVGRG